jgi:hypothetical protein
MSDVEGTAYAKVTWRLIPFLFLCTSWLSSTA